MPRVILLASGPHAGMWGFKPSKNSHAASLCVLALVHQCSHSSLRVLHGVHQRPTTRSECCMVSTSALQLALSAAWCPPAPYSSLSAVVRVPHPSEHSAQIHPVHLTKPFSPYLLLFKNLVTGLLLTMQASATPPKASHPSLFPTLPFYHTPD